MSKGHRWTDPGTRFPQIGNEYQGVCICGIPVGPALQARPEAVITA
jgi:hypothetical protein